MKTLSKKQDIWVEKHLNAMTLEEKVAHLLCPSWDFHPKEEWKKIFDEIPCGSMFVADWDADKLAGAIESVQAISKIPCCIAADFENGWKRGTLYPSAMACGAAKMPALMRKRGIATGRELRSAGIHWSFAPVVDIAINHRNVDTINRCFSTDPVRLTSLVIPLIEGMQQGNRIAATAKHFPGTGVDDRDQHLCTAINSLSVKQWRKTFGAVWQSVIDAGVMSVMAGHIAFPAYVGQSKNPWAALPATLDPKLMINLLRQDLGFDGVIVSDAGVMVGFASRVAKDEMAVRFIEAGGDVYLFPNVREDFGFLMAAVRKGRLTEERITASARRILEMKARLGLNENLAAEPISAKMHADHATISDKLSKNAMTVIRRNPAFARAKKLGKGSRVLTVSIMVDNKREKHRSTPLDIVDAELTKREMAVEHMDNPGHEVLLKKIVECDMIFFNFEVLMHQIVGNARVIDGFAMNFWKAFWFEYPEKVIFTSFGSPYHLYEFPHLPNMVLAYNPEPECQRAAVKVWLGEMKAHGTLPVVMPIEAGPLESVIGRS